MPKTKLYCYSFTSNINSKTQAIQKRPAGRTRYRDTVDFRKEMIFRQYKDFRPTPEFDDDLRPTGRIAKYPSLTHMQMTCIFFQYIRKHKIGR